MCQVSITTPVPSIPSITCSALSMLFTFTSKGMNSYTILEPGQCAAAALHTSARVLYEFMPFDVNVNSIETALDVVEGVEGSGVVIDTWHMAKLGIAPDDLRRIPLDELGWVELSDGQYENMADFVDEAVNHRRLPGGGEFDIRGYVEVCRDMGYAEAWGVEVLSQELRSQPINEMFRRTYEAAAAQFEPVAA